MYLKALELQGFKSFPEKTRLSFEKDITVIVGPNGSGKSNLSDALLWVMGEQKTRMLRGGKMEDVIFGGTEKRGAMGFAQVTLVLDNTTRILPLDADEVSISRRYYRSGDSEYYINREQVRLRDVTELLMDTGLGCDGYSIIGQGRISEIVSAKSTDRREIFEEAAGISRFRHRKDESERKLARTEENLLRIGDKISELEMQVEPLRKQSETAQKYLILRDQLREQEISLWMANLDRLHEQSELLRADYERSVVECTAARSEQDRLYAESERLAARMREMDVRSEELREKLRTTEAATADAESDAAVVRTQLTNNAETLQRLQREIGEQNERAGGIANQIRDHRARIESIAAERKVLADREEELRRSEAEAVSGMDEQNKRLADMLSRESALTGTIAENRTAIGLLEENLQTMNERAAQAKEEMAAAERKDEEASARLIEEKKKLAAAREKEQSLANVISGHTMLMAGREAKASEAAELQTKLTVELRSCESRIRLLSDLEKELEGFSKAAKIVMQESERGVLRGVHGPVGKMIRTEDRFALAVETALGAHVGDIIVDTQDNGKDVFALLKRRDGGRVTLQPLDVIRPARLNGEPKGEAGYVGVCSDLVECDKRYSAVIANLLGRTAVAETLTDAIAIARRHNNSFRIVTLDGQIVNAGGSMTGGSAGKNTGILSRANELQRLREKRSDLEAQLAQSENQKREAERELQSARYALDTAREEHTAAAQESARQEGLVAQAQILRTAASDALDALDEEIRTSSARRKENEDRTAALRESCTAAETELAALRENMAKESAGIEKIEARRAELQENFSNIRAQNSSLDAERSTVLIAIEQLERLRAEIETDSDTRRSTMAAVERQKTELEAQQTTLSGRIENLRAQVQQEKDAISQLTASKMELEGRRSTADKAAQEKNRALLDLERNSAQLEQKKMAADMEEQQIVEKLWDTYELSRSEAEKVRQPIESLAKAGKQVAELRRSMSALGNPNLGAIEEYQRVSERYNFLSEQRDDVQKSKDEIVKIISDITQQMEEIFVREIQEIDTAFREIFVELFGGGKASLSLEDMNDVLNCGIDIRIQPPGKAVSNISLLSGGEKAFVAIALYFAIMRVRPTPFCVMDEIESALDEENVARYAAYMRRMCGKTQFIAITHRRGTMDEADQLYGVTMQEKGVSTVLAMDMEEALKTIR